jgi:hypothetical protein
MADVLKMLLPYIGALRLYNQLRENTPAPLAVMAPGASFRLRQINGSATGWRFCVIEVRPEGIYLYPRSRTTQEMMIVDVASLRWFGRPKKYHDGHNDIWLHLEHDERWTLLEIRLHRYEMQDFVRALKNITPETMVKAYRRQRPYVHLGPIDAYPGIQDIHGAWKLSERVSLYITPLHLVILQGENVLRAIELNEIQQIMALPRMDEPTADGLVRFRVAEESMAFAIEFHQDFAEKLGEAARRSLEEPPIRKQKGYDEDEWE